jgi:ADP-heptose:LPS heptosyltransferase
MNPAIVKKILVISLSNIGDIVITFPVIDILIEGFPGIPLSVIVGPKGEELFEENANLAKVYVFNKRQGWGRMLRWLWQIKQERFDLIVDLRNTAIPFLIAGRYVTSPFLKREAGQHMLTQHLKRLRSIYPSPERAKQRWALQISQNQEKDISRVLERELGGPKKFVLVSAGAADQNKRWTECGFAETCDALIERAKISIVFVGHAADSIFTQKILQRMKHPAVNLCGRTTLQQLSALIKRSQLSIVNDSAALHLASYLDAPVLALFGPTDPIKYGPWGNQGQFIVKKENCPACRQPGSALGHQCMQAISSKDVLDRIVIGNSDVQLKDSFFVKTRY